MSNLEKIINCLDKSEYSTDQELIKIHCIDWRKKFFGSSNLIIFPKTVKKLSQIVKLCNKYRIPLVPQGGNTSLVGGSVPRKNKSEIILNLKNINRVRKLDELGFSIIVEGGCILEQIQNYVKLKNLVFPISMGSRGSCQIGGNIATNAGGLNVIKYGLLRNNIIGLEAIMSDGTVYSELKNIKKNNTGYDLKQILIGSEGTLGIITAANIKIFPKANDSKVIFASFKDFDKLLNFYLRVTNTFNDLLTSFEMINGDSMDLVIKHNMDLPYFIKRGAYYCLVELSNFVNIPNFYEFIINNLSKIESKVEAIIISKSENESLKLWKYREAIPPSETQESFCIQHDVSIPLESMNNFIIKTSKEIRKISNEISFINFGHLGDNNLHFNILTNEKTNVNKIKKNKDKITNIIYENTYKFNGSFSAEHGIGQLKRKELRRYKTKDEIKKMLGLKKIFDPKNILNPGKLL